MLILSKKLRGKVIIRNKLFPDEQPILIEITKIGGNRVKIGFQADQRIYEVLNIKDQQPNLLEEKQDAKTDN